MEIRKAAERGQVNLGWLQSQHSFSFGHYYDERFMGHGPLRVINQDVVQPGGGFGEHGQCLFQCFHIANMGHIHAAVFIA